MSNLKNIPQYLPLSKISQCTNINVLYYDSSAPTSNLLTCATNRIYLASDLIAIIKELDNLPAKTIKKLITASDILNSDATTLIEAVQGQYSAK